MASCRQKRGRDEEPSAVKNDSDAAAAPAVSMASESTIASPSKLRDRHMRSCDIRDTQLEAEDLDCEDPYGDEFEEEVRATDDEDDWSDDSGSAAGGAEQNCEDLPTAQDGLAGGDEESVVKPKRIPWMPGKQLEPGEELEVDPRAYNMLHHFELGWSCLSFDILPDALGVNRRTYPHSTYLVAGSQAPTRDANCVYAVKLSNMFRTSKDMDEVSDSEDSDDDQSQSSKSDYSPDPPEFRSACFKHIGTVNRVRVCPHLPRIVATWSDVGNVHIWDIQPLYDRLDAEVTDPNPLRDVTPKYTCRKHTEEGYAMDWDPSASGQFLSGGGDKKIFLYTPIEGGWSVENRPFMGHQGSVEDVQWKRVGDGVSSVFASASADASMKIWDIREGRAPVLEMPRAHDGDVNVCSWSPLAQDILLSGGDDGETKCWDMRHTQSPLSLVAQVKFHKQPISAVDWHPVDEAMFASSSLEDSVALWDMSVEADGGAPSSDGSAATYPDQLMFLHLGQRHISDVQWHKQIPGMLVTTAEDGFNVFIPSNMT